MTKRINRNETPDRSLVAVNKLVKVDTNSDFPPSRSGHRSVADENNFWVIGGYNPSKTNCPYQNSSHPLFRELWCFNIATAQWRFIKCRGDIPAETASPSALIEGRFLLVFGGTGSPFGVMRSNKLSACHLKSATWSDVSCIGSFPKKQYGQAMVVNKDKLFVFGGTTGLYYNNDIYQLDLCTHEWTKVIPNNSYEELPEERYRHEVALYNNCIYVLGGGTAETVCSLENLPVYSISRNQWNHVRTLPDSTHEFPKPRKCHGCVQMGDDAYVVGGLNENKIIGDVWKLNLAKLQWTKITDMPEPVYFHSVALTPGGCMFVFGGVTNIESGSRTNDLYRMWLRVPSLQNLSWVKLLNSCPNLQTLPKQKLLKLGILRDFINKLTFPEGA